MGSLKYLFYGIIIAYIINQPMKLIEGQIEKDVRKMVLSIVKNED